MSRSQTGTMASTLKTKIISLPKEESDIRLFMSSAGTKLAKEENSNSQIKSPKVIHAKIKKSIQDPEILLEYNKATPEHTAKALRDGIPTLDKVHQKTELNQAAIPDLTTDAAEDQVQEQEPAPKENETAHIKNVNVHDETSHMPVESEMKVEEKDELPKAENGFINGTSHMNENADPATESKDLNGNAFLNGNGNGCVSENEAAAQTDSKASFIASVGQLPITAAAVERAAALYSWAKCQNDYVRTSLERGETFTKDTAAELSSNNIVLGLANRLTPLDSAAGQRLEHLKNAYPVINQSPMEIYQATSERLVRFTSIGEYSAEALKSQLLHNYMVAKAKTNELVQSLQEQTAAVLQYGRGLELKQTAEDMRRGLVGLELFLTSTLSQAQATAANRASAAKETLGKGVLHFQNSAILVRLQQQLERRMAELDSCVGNVRSSLSPSQRKVLEVLIGKVEDTLAAWKPVGDHLLAYVLAKDQESCNTLPAATAPPTGTPIVESN